MALPQNEHCSSCVMHSDPTSPLCAGFMVPEGSGLNGVMIVAEALGKHEHDDGLPLRPHAAAGSVLQRAFDKMNVSRNSFTLANMIWGQPKLNKLEGEWYESQAIEHCSKYLRDTIQRVRPRAILACGNIPTKYLTGNTGKDRTVSSVRGYVFRGIGAANGIPVVPTYHPAFLARGSEYLLGVLIHDIGRALAVAKGLPLKGEWLDLEATTTHETLSHMNYTVNPTATHLRDWIEMISANPHLNIALDIETDYTKKGAKNEDEQSSGVGGDGSNITQIQFSAAKGSAIILQWDAPGVVQFVKEVLALPNVKLGHNLWRFDLPRLRREGLVINGTCHDTMVAHHHLQPDLPADLQFVASLHYFPFPWKHLGVADPVYGGADVDAVQYIWDGLPKAMQARGVWQSYLDYVVALQPTLDGMQERGIYIDLRERDRFKTEVEEEKVRLNQLLQETVPDEVKPIHPANGYKVLPALLRVALAALPSVAELAKAKQPAAIKALAGTEPYVTICAQHGFDVKEFNGEVRPYLREPFLPQSTEHIKNLIRYYGGKVPKNLDGDETTARTELERLIEKSRKDAAVLTEKASNPRALKRDEYTAKAISLYTLSDILQNSISYRQYNKIAATYIDGWTVDAQQLVHTTYTHRTATWQLSSIEPNVQNSPSHGKLAKAFKKCLAARPGHTLVNFDYKACHMLTMAFEAEDKDYERISRLDGHSFLAAHSLRKSLNKGASLPNETMEILKDLDDWLKLPDVELKNRLSYIKTNFPKARQRAKVTTLGNQLGIGAKKLYDNNLESFSSLKDAKEIQALLASLFPKVAKWKTHIKKLAAKQGYLMSRCGGIRWFWSMVRWNANEQAWVLGDDGEAALAFLIQNHAFGKIREAMIEIHQQGLDELFWMVNTVHDSLEFDCPNHLVESCIEEIGLIMRKPASKLIHPTLWPDGLSFDVECSVGFNKEEMKEVKL